MLAANVILLFTGSAIAGPDKTGQAIAFAHVNANSTIASFGGKGTTSVTVSGFTGLYVVTFTGNYPATITPDKLIINSTAKSFDYGVTNAYISSANKNHIVVRVFVWRSYDATALSNDVFVSVFLGR